MLESSHRIQKGTSGLNSELTLQESTKQEAKWINPQETEGEKLDQSLPRKGTNNKPSLAIAKRGIATSVGKTMSARLDAQVARQNTTAEGKSKHETSSR